MAKAADMGRVMVARKRPKAKAAAIGMARAGMHDREIRKALALSRPGFRSLKGSIVAGIWARGWWQ